MPTSGSIGSYSYVQEGGVRRTGTDYDFAGSASKKRSVLEAVLTRDVPTPFHDKHHAKQQHQQQQEARLCSYQYRPNPMESLVIPTVPAVCNETAAKKTRHDALGGTTSSGLLTNLPCSTRALSVHPNIDHLRGNQMEEQNRCQGTFALLFEKRASRPSVSINLEPSLAQQVKKQHIEPEPEKQYPCHALARKGSTSTNSTNASAANVEKPSRFLSLPCKLSSSTDVAFLSEFQIFLRLNIEAFCASTDDLHYKKGRNKRVRLNQVGIRCRHCAHVPSGRRTIGAAFFPATTKGFYQAAQNMSAMHLMCGACPEVPESIQAMFTQLLVTKTSSNLSKVGSRYWKECLEKDMGLINTEMGVFVGESSSSSSV